MHRKLMLRLKNMVSRELTLLSIKLWTSVRPMNPFSESSSGQLLSSLNIVKTKTLNTKCRYLITKWTVCSQLAIGMLTGALNDSLISQQKHNRAARVPADNVVLWIRSVRCVRVKSHRWPRDRSEEVARCAPKLTSARILSGAHSATNRSVSTNHWQKRHQTQNKLL